MQRRTILGALAALPALACLPAFAQVFGKDKTMRIVVPFAAGPGMKELGDRVPLSPAPAEG